MPEQARSDGRTARGQRTRDAIVDAHLALLREGELRITAPMVAARAGVSLRSVFQHFTDMETLTAVTCERVTAKVRSLSRPVDPELALPQRLAAFLDQRLTVLEWLTPGARVARLWEPFFPAARANRDLLIELALSQVRTVLAAELAAADAAARQTLAVAVHQACSWSSWEGLRGEQGLSTEAARSVVETTMMALLSCASIYAVALTRS